MNMDQLKDRLFAIRDQEHEVDNQIERLERLELKVCGIGSPTYSDMPKGSSVAQDRIAELLVKKIELEEEIKAKINWISEEKKWVENLSIGLRSSGQRAVIRMRYIDGENWKTIRNMMFSSKEDYEEREDSYNRRVFKLHGKALSNMLKSINKEN